jgi:polyphosphate kinase
MSHPEYRGDQPVAAGSVDPAATEGTSAAASGSAAHPPTSEDEALDSPDLFLNRELTWLAFNGRVLERAEEREAPLLERVKFQSIVASNLDEFIMKRIGGLKQQLGAGVQALTVDGRTPS